MSKYAYFARPVSSYDTPQDKQDVAMITAMGYEVFKITTEASQEAYKRQGMDYFLSIVKQADTLFFRAFPDGNIGAGVAAEIRQAHLSLLPVLELPSNIDKRTLSVSDTRAMLKMWS